MKKRCFIISILFFLIAPLANAAVCTFDDNPLPASSHYGGANSGSTGFTSGDAYFAHTDSSYAWNGWIYSNETDTTTPGHLNQFSAITGEGVNGSNNYAISYIMLDWMGSPPSYVPTYEPIPEIISFGAVTGEDYNTAISGAYFTNTTYSYLSMTNGDQFAKKFGGETGDDKDWFKIIIKGIKDDGTYTDSIDFYLADFRFDDNSLDYIVDEWTWVDLTGLGSVIGLEFSVDSSDKSAYGINTPNYFAIDDLNGQAPVPTPVPGAIWLLASGLLGLAGTRKKNA